MFPYNSHRFVVFHPVYQAQRKMAANEHLLEVLLVAPRHVLHRPCADYELRTGSWCDYCFALTWFPKEHWAPNQNTPLCTTCDYNHGRCHFCRGQLWVAPAAYGNYIFY